MSLVVKLNAEYTDASARISHVKAMDMKNCNRLISAFMAVWMALVGK